MTDEAYPMTHPAKVPAPHQTRLPQGVGAARSWYRHRPTFGVLASLGFTVTVGGVTVISRSTTGMARNSGSVRVVAGIKAGSPVSMDAVYIRPNISEMVACGTSLLYDTTKGMATTFLALVQGRLADTANWDKWTTNGTRLPLRSLLDGAPTGDNENVYGIPHDNGAAAFIVTGHRDFWRYTIGRAEAMGASQYFSWHRVGNRWPNNRDYPNGRAWSGNIYTGQSFADDRAHHPMCEPLAALRSGRQLLRDSLIGYAHGESMDGYQTYGTPPVRAWSGPDRQLRTGGYTTAIMAIARLIISPSHPDVAVGWIDESLGKNLDFQRAWLVTEQGRFGETWGRFRHENDPAWYPPWMDNLWTMSLCLLAQQQFPNALDTIQKRGNFQWIGWLQTGLRWPDNMVAYYMPVSASGAGTEYKTWPDLIAAAAAVMAIQTPQQKDSNYCRLMRSSVRRTPPSRSCSRA